MAVLSARVSVHVGVVSVGGRRGHQDVLGLALEKVVRHCDVNLQRQTVLLNKKHLSSSSECMFELQPSIPCFIKI